MRIMCDERSICNVHKSTNGTHNFVLHVYGRSISLIVVVNIIGRILQAHVNGGHHNLSGGKTWNIKVEY